MNTPRALARIEQIASISPIVDADAIELAHVGGWGVVVKKGEYQPGQPVLYIEVDTCLPLADPRFEFLADRGARTHYDTGHAVHVLKTARLRGVYSQGIVFDVADFPELVGARPGDDVTALVSAGHGGISKWDPPLPAELAGTARGLFPTGFQKTDEERIQNLTGFLGDDGGDWVATEKIDGTSVTVYVDGDYDGVASRNLDLVEADGNSMWAAARELDLHRLLREAFPGTSAAIQGELFGPGIQGNPLQVNEVQLRAFTIQAGGQEIPRNAWPQRAQAIAVPIHDLPYPRTLEEALAQADKRPSLINPARPIEGLVWRRATTAHSVIDGRPVRASWKVISNAYLLKHDR